MCGIIGYVGKHDPKGILLDGLKRLEYRGYDSSGIAILSKGEVQLFRSEGHLEELEKKLDGKSFEGSLGIGHTRWATHGAPTETNAHPHRVGSIVLIHNGIIENYLEHKEQVLKLGRSVVSDTDTEIVAHLFQLEVQSGKSLGQAAVSIFPKLKGSFAIVVFNEKEPEFVMGMRSGPPLLVGLGDGENFLISDVQAVLHRTKKFITLEDGQFAICRKDQVELRNAVGKEVPPVIETILWTADQAEKLGFRHFMLKEIHEQPQAITQTVEGNIDHQRGVVYLSELSTRIDLLSRVQKITIAACGTAKHAALIGKYHLERFAGIPVEVDFASEFRYRDPLVPHENLVILISQSGETADTLGAMRLAKERKIPTLSICNVRHSTLARESDIVLYTDAGPEIGVASTKAFTTQISVLYMLALHLGILRDRLGESLGQELSTEIVRLPYLIDKTLRLEKKIENMAQKLSDHSFFFYIARGVNFPIALEGALKLKEISYLHAEGYPGGELKHGPIALIDKKTVVVVLCPTEKPYAVNDNWSKNVASETIYEKLMSNLQESKARGGIILGIGTEGDKKLMEQCDHFLPIPQSTWAMNPILLSIPVQLFAYYVALTRGTDIDKPRNLAKSVTVE